MATMTTPAPEVNDDIRPFQSPFGAAELAAAGERSDAIVLTPPGGSPAAPLCFLDAWPEGWDEDLDGFNWELGPDPADDHHTDEPTPVDVLADGTDHDAFGFVCCDPRGPKGAVFQGRTFATAADAHRFYDRADDATKRALSGHSVRSVSVAACMAS